MNNSMVVDILDKVKEASKYSKDKADDLGEVFTPFELIDEILEVLPKEYFTDPTKTFFDPCAGKANFPAKIIERLMVGLESQYPNPEERYKHIIENQIFMSECQSESCQFIREVLNPNSNLELNLYEGNSLDMPDFKVSLFDVIIGNPPYNDALQTATKVNGSKMSSIGKILPSFIGLACDRINKQGVVLYVCPPSSEKTFRKFGKHINKFGFIHQKHWHKRIATCWWLVSNNKTETEIAHKGIGKILGYDPAKHRVNRDKNCIFLYNFATVVRVGPNPFHYADGRYNLTPTDLNIKNLDTLIRFIQPWFHNRINSWSSANKKIKYEWLSHLDFEITEQDIINHYGLNEDDIKEIKENI
jgi:hypothetical protein